MTITSVTLTNPGAETGDTTGWTSLSGGAPAVSSSGPHSGTFKFVAASSSANAVWYQDVDVTSHATAIDGGFAAFRLEAYHNTFSGDNDSGGLWIECYTSGGLLVANDSNSNTNPDAWTLEELYVYAPAGTRTVRIGTTNSRHLGGELSSYWDDFALEVSDDLMTDYPSAFTPVASETEASQIGVYALGAFPAEEARASQLGALALGAAETSSTFHDVMAHQLGIYVLCRPNADRRELRAWTFKQDDHEFYGIQLGTEGTLVWDKLTNQWCQWKSPGFVYWRAEDVCDWEGYNLAGDTESGKIFQIDPEGRLDYGDTPIVSRIVGYLTHRFRKNTPCYMAELALSEGQPPSGFADGTVGITLRTSTDDGTTFHDHGEVAGEGIGEDMTARWYGLGLMKSPGMLFEITDTGYARRIDGLDIEVPQDG